MILKQRRTRIACLTSKHTCLCHDVRCIRRDIKRYVWTCIFFTLWRIFMTDIADHFGTYISISNKHTTEFKSTLTSRCFSDTNIIKFKERLSKIDFTHIYYNLQCCNTAYTEFLKIYQTEFENTFPPRHKRKKENKFIKGEPSNF